MLERVRGADRAGLHVLIHAIGDRANDLILSIFEQVEKENGERDRRFRIEHAQHLQAAGHSAFCARPKSSLRCSPITRSMMAAGPKNASAKSARRQLTRFVLCWMPGATLAFGTDWTVAPLNPMWTIYAAVTRRTLDGKNPNGWVPEQKISVEETVRAYTSVRRMLSFRRTKKGRSRRASWRISSFSRATFSRSIRRRSKM